MILAPEIRGVLDGGRWAMVEAWDSLATLRTIPDSSVDAVISDPPYSSGGAFRGDRSGLETSAKYTGNDVAIQRPEFAGDNRDQRAFGYWCALWLAECLRVAKSGAPIAVFTDWRQLPMVTDAIQAGGWVWRGILPWDKTEGVRPVMGRFRAQCEFVVWGSNGPMPLREDVGVLPGVIRCSVRQDDKHHIAGKPTEVMRELSRVCPPGGIVLDPFSGSATTGVGALLEGRRFVGLERVKEYIAIGRERLTAAAAQVGLFEHRAGQVPLFGSLEAAGEVKP